MSFWAILAGKCSGENVRVLIRRALTNQSSVGEQDLLTQHMVWNPSYLVDLHC